MNHLFLSQTDTPNVTKQSIFIPNIATFVTKWPFWSQNRITGHTIHSVSYKSRYFAAFSKLKAMQRETRIFDLLDKYQEKWPEQDVALAKKENGEWKKYSPYEYRRLVTNVSYALIELGIQPNDKVAVISGNRPEWSIMDMAIMQVGGITVPIYPTISQDDYLFILDNCEARFVILEGLVVMNKIEAIRSQLSNLKYVYTMQDRGGLPYFQQLVELGQSHTHKEELMRRKAAVKPSDCFTIIYTSGTTGTPKGVMLSHNNMLGQLDNLRQTPDPKSKLAFSFLPLCHAYERMLVYLYQDLGMSVYYAESLATIADDMREIHPTMMSAVPRLLEKMYEKILLSGSKKKGLQRHIFVWSVKLTERYRNDPDDRSWIYNLKLKIADKLVYSKIRASLGADRFDIIVSGAASISQKVNGFFSAIGMPVFEGYGMTEASPVIAVSDKSKGGREVGTPGRALPGVEMKTADNGEILCRGHNVMMGYYKNPELTKEIIDEQGWLHTGDLGHIDEQGRIHLTGRIKSLFKTSMGKYVNPEIIEGKFIESEFFENVVVFGEGQKFAAAIIVPDFNVLKSWCQQHKIIFKSPIDALNITEVKDRIAVEVKKYNHYFGETEQIKKYTIVSDEWTVGNGILTPTLKVRRKVVQARYNKVITSMFA